MPPSQLRFKTGQINDILKSLVLQDLNGGRVGVVTYPSQDPLAKTLGSFQVDISDNPSLGDLLNKLRGARLAISFAGVNGPENFSATVLGVEKRQLPRRKDGGPAAGKGIPQPRRLNAASVRWSWRRSIVSSWKTRVCRTGTQPRARRRRRGARPGQKARGHPFQRHGRAARAARLRRGNAHLEGELPARALRRRSRRQQSPRPRCKAGPSWKTRPTTIGTTCA